MPQGLVQKILLDNIARVFRILPFIFVLIGNASQNETFGDQSTVSLLTTSYISSQTWDLKFSAVFGQTSDSIVPVVFSTVEEVVPTSTYPSSRISTSYLSTVSNATVDSLPTASYTSTPTPVISFLEVLNMTVEYASTVSYPSSQTSDDISVTILSMTDEYSSTFGYITTQSSVPSYMAIVSMTEEYSPTIAYITTQSSIPSSMTILSMTEESLPSIAYTPTQTSDPSFLEISSMTEESSSTDLYDTILSAVPIFLAISSVTDRSLSASGYAYTQSLKSSFNTLFYTNTSFLSTETSTSWFSQMFSTDAKSYNEFLYTSHQNLVSKDPAITSLRVEYFQTTMHTSTETLTSFSSVASNTGKSSTISYAPSKPSVPTSSAMLSQYLMYATSSFDLQTSANDCLCDCKSMSSVVSILSTAQTGIDQSIMLLSLVKDLAVEKKETSAYIRKHISADDRRQSAKAIGSIGIAIILIVFGVIISFDIPHFYKIMRPMLRCF